MAFTSHPLWLAGFRPFFALACLAGMLFPLAWTLIYGGLLPAPAGITRQPIRSATRNEGRKRRR